jgi:hypothetical protein
MLRVDGKKYKQKFRESEKYLLAKMCFCLLLSVKYLQATLDDKLVAISIKTQSCMIEMEF